MALTLLTWKAKPRKGGIAGDYSAGVTIRVVRLTRGRHKHRFLNASPMALIISACGVFAMASATWLIARSDSASKPTWSTFPWFACGLFISGLVIALTSANVDRAEYVGRSGRERLFRHLGIGLVSLSLAAGVPVCFSIYLGHTLSQALSYAGAGIVVMQIIYIFRRRTR